MMIQTFKSLRLAFASLAVALLVASTSHATLTLSMPHVTVLPTDTTVTMPVFAKNTSGSPLQLTSISTAISVSGGPGSATFGGPLPSLAANAGTAGFLFSGKTLLPASINANPNLARFDLAVLGAGEFATLGAGEEKTLMTITFNLSSLTLGSVFDVDISTDPLDTPDVGSSSYSVLGSASLTPLSVSGSISAVPEPSAFALMGLVGGVAAVGNWYRKKRAAAVVVEGESAEQAL
jgi:hypothetical protein